MKHSKENSPFVILRVRIVRGYFVGCEKAPIASARNVFDAESVAATISEQDTATYGVFSRIEKPQNGLNVRNVCWLKNGARC